MSEGLEEKYDDEVHELLKTEIESLYDDFVNKRLDHHYTSYFPQLKVYFNYGKMSVKNHAFELILNIILGGKWAQEGKSKTSHRVNTEKPSDMGIVQWRLLQISNRIANIGDTKVPEVEYQLDAEDGSTIEEKLTSAQAWTREIKIDLILMWLEEILLSIEDTQIFTIFFIFINTHWQHIKASKPEAYERLRALHFKLMDNVKYAKLGAFERLNMSYYSASYRPIQ